MKQNYQEYSYQISWTKKRGSSAQIWWLMRLLIISKFQQWRRRWIRFLVISKFQRWRRRWIRLIFDNFAIFLIMEKATEEWSDPWLLIFQYSNGWGLWTSFVKFVSPCYNQVAFPQFYWIVANNSIESVVSRVLISDNFNVTFFLSFTDC